MASFPGETLADKIGVTKLDEIILNSMSNSWSKQFYVKVFDYEYNSFKKSVNMFERMEISEYIYEGVVESSYKKPTREYAKRSGHIRNKRGESASYNTNPTTSESTGKCRKQYIYCSASESKSCLIHVPGHSSDKYKVLGDFGANYARVKPTRYHGNNPIPRKN